MRKLGALVIGFLLALLPSLVWAQGTDRSEMDQWIKDTQKQTEPPVGTTITMANWQQYKSVMPLGMIKLFEGTYGWKMPADVQMPIGPARYGIIPRTWVEATEKYGSQTQVEVLPNGHYRIKNYYGGTPFPNPTEPNKGWKILANNFWFVRPALYVNTEQNYGTVWAVDRFGDIAPSSFDVVYRQSAYITDPGFPHEETYAPGIVANPVGHAADSRAGALHCLAVDLLPGSGEKYLSRITYVFVPALRRSLRLSTASRCSPVFGFDWAYDDANGNGFNGSTAIYTADFLGDRSILSTRRIHDGRRRISRRLRHATGMAQTFVGQMVDTADVDHRCPSHSKRSVRILLFEPDNVPRQRVLGWNVRGPLRREPQVVENDRLLRLITPTSPTSVRV